MKFYFYSQFDIEESENCNRDYVEIHEGGPEGRLLLHSCGSDVPTEAVVASSSKLWIKFNSDNGGVGRGFLAEYSLIHGGQFQGRSGVIASPSYPNVYTPTPSSSTYGRDQPIVWTITGIDQNSRQAYQLDCAQILKKSKSRYQELNYASHFN